MSRKRISCTVLYKLHTGDPAPSLSPLARVIILMEVVVVAYGQGKGETCPEITREHGLLAKFPVDTWDLEQTWQGKGVLSTWQIGVLRWVMRKGACWEVNPRLVYFY